MAELLTDRLEHGGVLVIKDTLAASGSFVFALLLRKTVQDGREAVLVLVEQTFSHYQQVLRKLGCNLGASRDAGQVTVVEVLAAPLDWDARGLYTRVRDAVIAANADSAGKDNAARCVLFCDGLSTLAALVGDARIRDDSGETAGQGGRGGGGSDTLLGGGGASPVGGASGAQWTAFMHYVVQLGQGMDSMQAAALVAIVHADVKDDRHWLCMLDHRSDTLVEVAPLESGHSSDVSGEVSVLCRKWRQDGSGAVKGGMHPRLSSYYFRTTDNAATFVKQ